jgi:hypothetical protein
MNGLLIKVDAAKGAYIGTVCNSAKELSEFIKEDVEFEFNGVRVTTKNQSIQEMITSYATQRK